MADLCVVHVCCLWAGSGEPHVLHTVHVGGGGPSWGACVRVRAVWAYMALSTRVHTPRRGAEQQQQTTTTCAEDETMHLVRQSRASHFPARLRTWGQRLPIHLIMNNE